MTHLKMARVLSASFLLSVLFFSVNAQAQALSAEDVHIEFPAKRLSKGAAFKGAKLVVKDAKNASSINAKVRVFGVRSSAQKAGDSTAFVDVKLSEGKGELSGILSADSLRIEAPNASLKTVPVPLYSPWWALVPAFLAILLALVTREVVLSLLGAIFVGVVILKQSFFASLTATLDLLVNTAADASKLKVVFFTLLMGAMVTLISRGGGSKGIVQWVSSFAKTRRSGALSTWAMGLAIFFDDYASTLLVGNTMRPITDKLRISREKLSYIIDSTAAPIASIAFVSTWTGYEIETLKVAMQGSKLTQNATEVFVQGLPLRFYPIFALCFVGLVAFMRRDFGPMLKAENRALGGELLREGAVPMVSTEMMDAGDEELKGRALVAILPILSLVIAVIATLKIRGSDASYDALVYGAAVGVLVAYVAGLGLRAFDMREGVEASLKGIRAMVMAVVVLFLAWGIAKVMEDLEAGPFIASLVGDALPTWSLSTVTFLLAAIIALATGTSWGTMSILFPVVIPVVAVHSGSADFGALLAGVSSSILAGAVFGDHCSPISDTTVLSSISAAADHIDHTKTQAPYALVCAFVAIIAGTLPQGFGLSPLISIPLGLSILIMVLRFFGKRTEDATL